MFMISDSNQTAKGICPSPTGEDRWGLMAESGSYIMTNYYVYDFSQSFQPLSFSPIGERLVTFVLSKTSSANHFSPLSFSPVGERLVTPICQRLVDTGYSVLSKTGSRLSFHFANLLSF